MKRFILLTILALQLNCFAVKMHAATDDGMIILEEKTEENKKTKFPKKPAYRPVYCVVSGNEIDVYCQFETLGDILIVDARTGMTVASETAVELGEGYTISLPEQYAQAPLTIYVTVAGITYWAEI